MRIRLLPRLLPLVLGLYAIGACSTGEHKTSGQGAGADTLEVQAEPLPDSVEGSAPLYHSGVLTYPNSPITYEVCQVGDSLCVEGRGLDEVDLDEWSPIEGKAVVGAEVADLNADGHPELLVYLRSLGADARMELLAYSPNRGKSVSEAYLPDFREDPALALGYGGGEEMAVVERTLVLRYPLYRDEGGKRTPTGQTRQIQYRLTDGEAGRVFRPSKVVEY